MGSVQAAAFHLGKSSSKNYAEARELALEIGAADVDGVLVVTYRANEVPCEKFRRVETLAGKWKSSRYVLGDVEVDAPRWWAGVAALDTQPRWAVVDTETTGLDADARIVEIAVIVLDGGGRQLHEWTSLVNPGISIPASASKIHGIYDHHVAGSPKFTEISSRLDELLSGLCMVAHNAAYDTRIILGEYARASLSPPMAETLCTMYMTARLYPGESKKLENLARLADVEHNSAHRAMGDAKATAGLLRHAMERGVDLAEWRKPVSTPPRPRAARPAPDRESGEFLREPGRESDVTAVTKAAVEGCGKMFAVFVLSFALISMLSLVLVRLL